MSKELTSYQKIISLESFLTLPEISQRDDDQKNRRSIVLAKKEILVLKFI